MTSTFTPCLAILPKEQQLIWPNLRPTTELGFTLYGGTAIALRLGHRESIDFDFFSEKPLDRESIARAMPFITESVTTQDSGHTWVVLAEPKEMRGSRVKISFFGNITFGRVGEPEFTEDGVLRVASLDDLMATKLKVILQRAELKDYRDISAMLQSGVSLEKGLASAGLLFGRNFQPSESLKAMTYFSDGDLRNLKNTDRHALTTAADQIASIPDISLKSQSLTERIEQQATYALKESQMGQDPEV
jgi:hypothetical protein